MAEESPAHPPTQPKRLLDEMAVPAADARRDGRCDQCGYALIGLPQSGVCPECGSRYTDASAKRLQPWPSAAMVCLRLGWPLAGMALAVAAASAGRSADAGASILTGWACAIALPINSYFQVRSMLKKSLPEQKRTRGGIATLRAIGTTFCVLVFLVVLAPFVFLAACLISMSGDGAWH